ncbi:GNAT family N-acetyltransferase [Latilactobacillus curvatus]|uniref:GNAT family N-acetyltransferase n=1 Tax=Latilactobacillus curvatus TaxID=28038 RepID=UPI0020A567BE|nr:GNAT family N-acetyltransferase [Latilactobacillus curvatus]MCT3358449.1 GNAT family N-acetyltransferase [Latilactobacillus curvatus]UTB76008.1 acetyltransferase [Latilactobacillus curvatus]
MLTNQLATASDYQLILNIWEQSVLATHDFLKPDDLNFYKEQIPQFFNQTTLRIWSLDHQPIGFTGTNGPELEMFFLDPHYIGGGHGHQILTWLINHQQITKIDVNEQNQHAKTFYLNHGFTVASRSERDGFGKPYPILHLEK